MNMFTSCGLFDLFFFSIFILHLLDPSEFQFVGFFGTGGIGLGSRPSVEMSSWQAVMDSGMKIQRASNPSGVAMSRARLTLPRYFRYLIGSKSRA